MIAGGGTGGHIYPAIAVAQEFVARGPQRSVVFVGTEYGLEKQIVPKAGFPLEFISVGGLKGKSIGQTARNLLLLPRGFAGAWRLISRYKPAVIMGVGGYSSGPVLLAGALRRVPTLVHEQNAYPGITNRILARFVDQVAVAFDTARERLGGRGVVTGNPIRKAFFETAVRPSSASGGRFRILVFGGSQGSRILNDAVTAALFFLGKWKGRIEFVHQTGPADQQKVAEAYRASTFHDARVVAYLDPMVDEIAGADLVVSRAGAMTIGELCAVGRASILVPFALATNNHQEMNARVVEGAGGAVVVTEKELRPERLAGVISGFLEDPARAAGMGSAARTLAAPGATSEIVNLIDKIGRI
jgi:UDP-N-acetylglucosamine--N-acetylmuramyl-(pentapeptide) pyrophosphoryl-undecaprenol N-acetylglucosamine transferase